MKEDPTTQKANQTAENVNKSNNLFQYLNPPNVLNLTSLQPVFRTTWPPSISQKPGIVCHTHHNNIIMTKCLYIITWE